MGSFPPRIRRGSSPNWFGEAVDGEEVAPREPNTFPRWPSTRDGHLWNNLFFNHNRGPSATSDDHSGADLAISLGHPLGPAILHCQSAAAARTRHPDPGRIAEHRNHAFVELHCHGATARIHKGR
ncbi:hypothetical protein GCM10029976_049190 [Kribbella albertanoniae]